MTHACPVQPLIIFGVAGSGKSTVAQRLCEHHLPQGLLLDADDFHPPANKKKMAAGIALSDEDRWPWLEALNQQLHNNSTDGLLSVLACSALKESYRKVIAQQLKPHWCHLNIAKQEAQHRVKQRHSHFFPGSILDNQFELLERPDYGLEFDAEQDVDYICQQILKFTGI